MRFVNSAIPGWLREDAVIVTPSALLASVIQRQFTESHIRSGRTSWRPASVLSIGAWLRQTWRESRSRLATDVPGLLSPAQELVLWQRAIRETETSLFDVAATAQTARRVGRLIAEWEVPISHPSWSDDQDAETYLQWWLSVQNRCRQQNWMCAVGLWTMCSEHTATLTWPNRLIFAGFQELVPALRTLAAKLTSRNVSVHFIESEAAPVAAQILPCETPEHELDFAARWARTAYESDGASSIAVIVPDLRSRRLAVEGSFRNIFYPSSVLESINATPRSESIFHLHSGRPLREHPIIATALRILEFADDQMPLATASALLRSPFLQGGRSERVSRAATDAKLRSLREMDVTLGLLEQRTVSDCVALRSIWRSVRTALDGRPHGSASCAAWARFVSALLKAAGWPGDAELSPIEQAAADQWREVLSTLGSLGLTSDAVSWTEAVRLLRDLASVEGPMAGDLQSPVQVLDPIHATSVQFDRAWTVGLSDGKWPQPPPAVPFIPSVLQRRCGMPSTSEGRRRESERRIEALHQCARAVFGSYSGEGTRNPALSTQIKNFVLREADQLSLWSGKPILERIAPAVLQELDDTRGPLFQIQGAATGGTYLIKSQSTCPFRAFTESRLHAREWDEGIFAFDQRDRGMFIHHAFAMFWQEVQTSDRLHQLSTTELNSRIEDVAEKALAEEEAYGTFRQQLRKAEQERIARVLHAWLELEKRRTIPFKVLEVEAKRNLILAGLPLQVRIDRIDELETGDLIVIDYKSGNPQLKDLDGERPKEPQLLVYATALGPTVKGIYFGKLQARNEQAIGYAGQVHFGGNKDVTKRNWNEQLEEWKQLVHGLAQEFVDGYALATPDGKICKYCAIKPVCRIEEASGLLAVDQGNE